MNGRTRATSFRFSAEHRVPRGTRFESKFHVRFLREGAFDAQGIVSVPLAKLLHWLGALDAQQLRSVEECVCLWLGIEPSRDSVQ